MQSVHGYLVIHVVEVIQINEENEPVVCWYAGKEECRSVGSSLYIRKDSSPSPWYGPLDAMLSDDIRTRRAD